MITRREWLLSSGAGALLVACHSNPAKPDAAPDASSCSVADPQIVFMDPCVQLDPICAPNHSHAMHTVAVPSADVVAGVEMTYPVVNPSHSHMITVTADQFATLQGGGSIMVETTIAVIGGTNMHTHYIQIICG